MKLRNVRKTYHNQNNDVEALKGISLDLNNNGITVILGSSGCGKTTLLNCIASKEYLREHRPILFNDLILRGQLWTYLADLNEQAQNRLEVIIDQMKASEGVTEELKAADQMEWVGAMNSILNRAEEIILREMIYEGMRYEIT